MWSISLINIICSKVNKKFCFLFFAIFFMLTRKDVLFTWIKWYDTLFIIIINYKYLKLIFPVSIFHSLWYNHAMIIINHSMSWKQIKFLLWINSFVVCSFFCEWLCNDAKGLLYFLIWMLRNRLNRSYSNPSYHHSIWYIVLHKMIPY